MKRDEFLQFLRDLTAYYDRRTVPTKHAIDLWFQEVERARIPAEAVQFIFEHIIKGPDFPRNVPLAIKEGFQCWARDQGAQWDANNEAKHCPVNCNGGILFMKRYDEEQDRDFGYAFRCKHCGRSNATGIPAAFLDELQREGYSVNKGIEA